MNLYKSHVLFNCIGQSFDFVILHNLYDCDISLDFVVRLWSMTNPLIEVESLCNYISNYDPEFVCITEEEYDEFIRTELLTSCLN
jgi:hypothetical protein